MEKDEPSLFDLDSICFDCLLLGYLLHAQVIAPKFDEFSEKYPDAVFLKVLI
jgi:hypothetical protein